jgi:hypothetical protein
MLAFYGICIVGLAIGAFLWFGQQFEQEKTRATSTAAAFATERAQATATAIAHREEQDRYEFIDTFNSNVNGWRSGSEYGEYWNGYTGIRDGVYRWEVRKTKDTFVAWADFPDHEYVKDFDVYVDTQVVEGQLGDVCSGLLFRISPSGWDAGGYYFALCNDSTISITYHTDEQGWQNITRFRHSVEPSSWNRMEISARGSHFTFYVNGEQVYEMDDDRQAAGGLALVIEINDLVDAEVAFDNFGFQPRE